MTLLVFNAGSATLKFAVFDGASPRCRMRGQVGDFGGATQLVLSVRGQTRSRRIKAENHAAAAAAVLTEPIPQESAFDDRALVVGHRLVHGGARCSAPLRLDPQANANLTPGARISADSAIACHVLAVDEEAMIARTCLRVAKETSSIRTTRPSLGVTKPCKPSLT
jgi:acetate kinase